MKRIATIALLTVATCAVSVSSEAFADSGVASGTAEQVITESVCSGEFAPVTYDDDWRTKTVTLPGGRVHLDDVLRDDLTVEAAGSDGSHVHA